MPESSSPRTIPIPTQGFVGVRALMELGEERLDRLAELLAGQPLDLSFRQLYSRLAEALGCDPRMLQVAFGNALIPLNGLRRNLKLTSSELLRALVHTVSEKAPPEWKKEHQGTWERVADKLLPFLEPDNFFGQASKAFDLLSERPAVLQGARILTELRPIYDEAPTPTKTLAYLLTDTLVVDYWDGQAVRSLHVTLDNSDLEKLGAEVERAKTKVAIIRKEATDLGTNVVIYGGSAED